MTTPDLLSPIKLEDRLLWVDGSSSVVPEKLEVYALKLASRGAIDRLAVTELTPSVLAYNAISESPIKVKHELDAGTLPFRWVLPEHYKYLDLDEYLIGLGDRIEHDDLLERRCERLSQEIYTFKKLQLDDVLRMLIYVVDRLRETKSIWGVGRGSSCSSYLLYLLGLHEVDPVRYSIDFEDFIREET